ncbi:MAG: Ppx/GppA phosphatase family protein [Pseudomonadota bacterium]
MKKRDELAYQDHCREIEQKTQRKTNSTQIFQTYGPKVKNKRLRDVRNMSSVLQHAKPQMQNTGKDDVSVEKSFYGALDLGTNNCRLLVAKPTRRNFLVVDAFSRIVRLGEGLTQTKRLSDEAMERAIAALKICAHKMGHWNVKKTRVIATEACRIADNCDEFIEKVRRETALKLEIVSNETEAKLAVSGCASLLDKESDWALIFDIGGGSTELIWLDLSKHKNIWQKSLSDRLRAQNCIVGWTSLPIGVVNLAEKYDCRNVNAEIFSTMVADVLQLLKRFEDKHRISEKLADQNVHFLGTSGTVTTLAGVHLGLDFYDRKRVDGIWLDGANIREVSKNLTEMPYEVRIQEPCIGEERADLVLAGCAILEALMRLWPVQRLRVADRGLREGMLATLIAEDSLPNT